MSKFISLLLFIFVSCTYKDNSPMSAIYRDHGPDPSQYDGSTGDTSKQWRQTDFTSFELSLFDALDTVNLAGTSTPAQLPTSQSPGFPNPFQHYMYVGTGFSLGPNDIIIAKYVIVDESFHAVEAGVRRITTGQFAWTIGANLQSRYYRVYVTYSASGNEHFYRFWGNIQKN